MMLGIELERRRVVGEGGVEERDPGLDVARCGRTSGPTMPAGPGRRRDGAIGRQVEVPDRSSGRRTRTPRGTPWRDRARPAGRRGAGRDGPRRRSIASPRSTSARPIPWRRRSGRTTAILNSGETKPTSSAPSNAPPNWPGSAANDLQDERALRVRRRAHVAGLDRAGHLARRAHRRRRPEDAASVDRPRGRRGRRRSGLGAVGVGRGVARRRSGARAPRTAPASGGDGASSIRSRPGLGLRERHDLADVRLVGRAAPPSGRCRARSRRGAARRTRTPRASPRTCSSIRSRV